VPYLTEVELEGADVYVHRKDASSRATVTRIDVEPLAINESIEPNENAFVGGERGACPPG
jgi:hypothetical protein